MKLQIVAERQPELYPISREDMVADFELLERYDDSSLQFLKDDYQTFLPDNNPAHHLMKLESRPYLRDVAQMRKAYRVGVIAGSIIIRGRMYQLDENPIDLNPPIEKIPQYIKTRDALSRVALGQFFDTNVDVKSYLYNTVEVSWQEKHVSFLPALDDLDQPKNDWMAVGLGDILDVTGNIYDTLHGLKPKVRRIKSLEPETHLQ